MKYVYPAIFVKEPNGAFSVNFPDLPCCYTQGDNLEDAIVMAEDVLCLTLYRMEVEKSDIPSPSEIKDIKTDDASVISLVRCDTMEYREYYLGKAIKKTLTIPSWLNTEAEKAGVNFSQTLQDALKEHLGL